MITTMKTGYNKINLSGIALLAAIVVFRAEAASTVPVISDIGIFSGERGTAVTIKADAAFSADVSSRDKEISIVIAKAVYGLNDFFFDKLPQVSPVASIKVIERKGAELSIVFIMKETAGADVRTIYKNGQLMALLSKKPSLKFSWNAGVSTRKEDRLEKSVAVVPEKVSTPASLTNIRLLERDKISELAFEFDRKVSGTVKRMGNRITLSVDNAKNSLSNERMKLPDNSSFNTIKVNNKKGNVSIMFQIDTSKIDTSLNIAFTQGEVLSIFITKRSDQKATLWTSGRGLAVDHTFYNVPSYSSDMTSIEKRATLDAAKKISKDTVFAVKVEHKQKPVQNPVSVENRMKPEEKQIEKPADKPVEKMVEPKTAEVAQVQRVPMKIVSNGTVNMRKAGSLKGRVCRKLKNGDVVECVKQYTNWTKVIIDSDTGFVASAFIRQIEDNPSNDHIEVPETVMRQAVVPQERLLTKVSTTMIKDETKPDAVVLNTAPAIPNVPDPGKRSDEKHKLIKYHGSGRDPFMPILSDSVSPSDVPSVQNLSLVGVLVDDVDRIALCEDLKNGNKPYTLREHDQVFKGRVLKIYRDKVVFLLTEYGISRSFTLSIMNNKGITEASKK